jgi:hypothetical protein
MPSLGNENCIDVAGRHSHKARLGGPATAQRGMHEGPVKDERFNDPFVPIPNVVDRLRAGGADGAHVRITLWSNSVRVASSSGTVRS